MLGDETARLSLDRRGGAGEGLVRRRFLKSRKAIGGDRPAAKHAIPELRKALGDHILNVCWLAAKALAKIGTEAIPELKKTLAGKDTSSRLQAAAARGRSAQPQGWPWPNCDRHWAITDMFLRWAAATALGKIGPAATKHYPN